MIFSEYFLLLLTTFIYLPISHGIENDFSFFSNNTHQKIKRFLFGKWKNQIQSQDDEEEVEDLLFNNGLTDKDKAYTEEDLAEINRILSKKEDDYYGILNINRKATPENINNAFRKLARRLHPDKFNGTGAKEATQRLNRARTELLKRFPQPNQNDNQQTTTIERPKQSTTDENKITDEPDLLSTLTPLPSKDSSTSRKSNYVLFVCIILIIGIVISVVFWIKRQRHISSSRKSNRPRTYGSPGSNEDKNKNRNSEISILHNGK